MGREGLSLLALRPPLASIRLQGKIPTPHGGYTALCRPQGPAPASSWELNLFSWLVLSALVTFTFSLFTNTKTFSVLALSSRSYLLSSNHHGSCPLCSFRSRPEISPHPLLTISVTLTRFYCLYINRPHQKCPSPLIIWSLSHFPFFVGCTVFLLFSG